jgi:tetratricopeptide (TPR) repeat protein
MTDGFPDRLSQLRTRWQGDPSSRVFLQLAEEYRHLGRVQDALEVLDSGLKEHPGYLSALVAKGRCLLELGDADKARGVLERVVQQDATQMVANKLLVRAYLETGEPERAGQRLDLYSLLNDSDPEIEELRRRVVAMSRPPRAPDGPRPEEPAERPRMDPTETPEAEVFDLGPAVPGRSFAAEEDVFGLGMLPETLPAAPVPSVLLQRGEGNGAEPFPDPAPEESRRRYLAGLWAERIFFLDDLAAEAAPAAAAAAASVAEPSPPPAPPAAAPVAEPSPSPAAAAAAPVAAAAATVTLAELYLRQGHVKEAERLFGEILDREPGNAAAREGLSRLTGPVPATGPAPAAAAPSPAEQPPAPAPTQEAPTPPASAQALQPAQAAPPEPAPMSSVPTSAAAGPDQAALPGEAAHPAPAPAPSPAAPAPRERALEASHLLAGLDDPQASRKVRRTYLLHSYLARLRQPRSPHVP